MKQEHLSSLFCNTQPVEDDPIFGLNSKFKSDKRKEKLLLTVGFYSEGNRSTPRIFNSVRRAEEAVLKRYDTKVYLPIDGDPDFVDLTGQLIFGDHYSRRVVYGAQTVGATSALKILSEFIKAEVSDQICLSNFTWANHAPIFRRSKMDIDYYPYWSGKFDFDEMYEHLSQLPNKTIVLLQPSCHNPTGIDITMNEWEALSDLFLERGLIPFFDTSYQGFGSGLALDVEPIRYFFKEGHEFFVANSFSKNMSLYGERTGALYIVFNNAKLLKHVESNIKSIIRTEYSNPPRHGAMIAKMVLENHEDRRLWEEELDMARTRIRNIREEFFTKLSIAMPDRNFDHIKQGHGFWTILGINKEQVTELREKFAIYATNISRINLAAISHETIDYVVDSMSRVCS